MILVIGVICIPIISVAQPVSPIVNISVRAYVPTQAPNQAPDNYTASQLLSACIRTILGAALIFTTIRYGTYNQWTLLLSVISGIIIFICVDYLLKSLL